MDDRVYVVGSPRTGTSVASLVTEALGVDFQYTSVIPAGTVQGEYVANDCFMEARGNMFETLLYVHSTPFSGYKILLPLTLTQWQAQCITPSRCFLMKRDPSAIRQSQEAFFAKPAELGWAHREAELRSDYTRALMGFTERRTLAQGKLCEPFDFMVIDYTDLCDDTLATVSRMAAFIGVSQGLVSRAASLVNPSKRRFKTENLAVGI